MASAARRVRDGATSSSPRLRGVPSRTIYRVRYISLERERALPLLHTSGLLYVRTHPYVRTARRLRSELLVQISAPRDYSRMNDGANARRNIPIDGTLYWYPICRRSPGFRRQRLPPRPFSFLGKLSAIKQSIDLLRTSPRAQRDVLIVQLDRYDSSLYAGLVSINLLVGI